MGHARVNSLALTTSWTVTPSRSRTDATFASSRSTRPRSTSRRSATASRRRRSRSACSRPAARCAYFANRRPMRWIPMDACSATWSAYAAISTSTSNSSVSGRLPRTSTTIGAGVTRVFSCDSVEAPAVVNSASGATALARRGTQTTASPQGHRRLGRSLGSRTSRRSSGCYRSRQRSGKFRAPSSSATPVRGNSVTTANDVPRLTAPVAAPRRPLPNRRRLP